jgi:hypothetical protein
MINHRVLPKIKKRHPGEKRQANADHGAKPPPSSPPRFRSSSYLAFHLAGKNASAPRHRKSISSTLEIYSVDAAAIKKDSPP